jgi:hypothetical protein
LRGVEIFPGVPKPEGRASGTNVKDEARSRAAAVRWAQEFSPKLAKRSEAEKEYRDK